MNDAVKLFLLEVDERIKERGLTKTEFSYSLFGDRSRLTSFRTKQKNLSTKTLEKIAEAVDGKLIICLGDKDQNGI